MNARAPRAVEATQDMVAANRLTSYWRAGLDWQAALSIAQDHGVADAKSLPLCDDGANSRMVLLDVWRAALRR